MAIYLSRYVAIEFGMWLDHSLCLIIAGTEGLEHCTVTSLLPFIPHVLLHTHMLQLITI